eukprot:3429966-Alexandrium_andersonii.AAC.1
MGVVMTTTVMMIVVVLVMAMVMMRMVLMVIAIMVTTAIATMPVWSQCRQLLPGHLLYPRAAPGLHGHEDNSGSER